MAAIGCGLVLYANNPQFCIFSTYVGVKTHLYGQHMFWQDRHHLWWLQMSLLITWESMTTKVFHAFIACFVACCFVPKVCKKVVFYTLRTKCCTMVQPDNVQLKASEGLRHGSAAWMNINNLKAVKHWHVLC